MLCRDRGVCNGPDSKKNWGKARCSRGRETRASYEKTLVNGDEIVCYIHCATHLGLICGWGNDDCSGRNGDDAKNEYDFC